MPFSLVVVCANEQEIQWYLGPVAPWHFVRITCSGSYCNKEEVYFFPVTAWSYRSTFFLGYYLPKLSNNIYSLKFY